MPTPDIIFKRNDERPVIEADLWEDEPAQIPATWGSGYVVRMAAWLRNSTTVLEILGTVIVNTATQTRIRVTPGPGVISPAGDWDVLFEIFDGPIGGGGKKASYPREDVKRYLWMRVDKERP